MAAVHLLADVARLTAEIRCKFKVISTFVEERLPANCELIPSGLNLLRQLCNSQSRPGSSASRGPSSWPCTTKTLRRRARRVRDRVGQGEASASRRRPEPAEGLPPYARRSSLEVLIPILT